ncbi:hypothetical protein Tco_1573427, partial [Tanacetum coccineum]
RIEASGYGVLRLFRSWSLVSAGMDTPYLLDGYGVLRQWCFDSSKYWIRRIGLE